MSPEQIAFEIGMLGKAKAVPLLMMCLNRFQGNITQVKNIEKLSSEVEDLVVAPMTLEQDIASDKEALKMWNDNSQGKYSERNEKIYNFIKSNPGIKGSLIKKNFNLTNSQWYYHAKCLLNRGLIKRENNTRNAIWFAVY